MQNTRDVTSIISRKFLRKSLRVFVVKKKLIHFVHHGFTMAHLIFINFTLVKFRFEESTSRKR